MSFGRYLCLLVLAALLAPPAAFAPKEERRGGARLRTTMWAWLTEYAGEDQESWDEQGPKEQEAALARSKAAAKGRFRLATTGRRTA